MISRINSRIEIKFRKMVKSAIAEPTSIDLVTLSSKKQSADLIEANLKGSVLFSNRVRIQEYAARLSANHAGDFLEMGVYKGTSISRFSGLYKRYGVKKRLIGIDTFKGLDDAWSNVDHLDAFDLKGNPPKLGDPQITLLAGSVIDVLPGWLKENEVELSLIHFDMDLYEPTKFALELLKHKLKPGSLVLFDNLHSYPGWQYGEYRALTEVFSDHEFVYRAFGPYQCLVQLSHVNE